MSGWKLWLDDQIEDPYTPERHPPEGFRGASSVTQALTLIRLNGLPDLMDLDHDLGEGMPTGLDFCKKLVCEFLIDDLIEVTFGVHSMNPVGARNIQSYLDSWNRFCRSEKERKNK